LRTCSKLRGTSTTTSYYQSYSVDCGLHYSTPSQGPALLLAECFLARAGSSLARLVRHKLPRSCIVRFLKRSKSLFGRHAGLRRSRRGRRWRAQRAKNIVCVGKEKRSRYTSRKCAINRVTALLPLTPSSHALSAPLLSLSSRQQRFHCHQ
jgi:hypothetical protein